MTAVHGDGIAQWDAQMKDGKECGRTDADDNLEMLSGQC